MRKKGPKRKRRNREIAGESNTKMWKQKEMCLYTRKKNTKQQMNNMSCTTDNPKMWRRRMNRAKNVRNGVNNSSRSSNSSNGGNIFELSGLYLN